MDDLLLDRLGTYFVHHDILNRYGVTFENYIRWVQMGIWEAWVS
jgi:hypothetical protein